MYAQNKIDLWEIKDELSLGARQLTKKENKYINRSQESLQ